MKKVRIAKLGPVENPSQISTFGESQSYHEGYLTDEPEVGKRFILYPVGYEYGQRGINTSPVTKIVDKTTFETLNSVYKYELISE